MTEHHQIRWLDRGREPTQRPDPEFPNGRDIDTTHGAQPSCKVELPYPAKRCGIYVVLCTLCDCTYAITTAGRPDDPRSVVMECKRHQTN